MYDAFRVMTVQHQVCAVRTRCWLRVSETALVVTQLAHNPSSRPSIQNPPTLPPQLHLASPSTQLKLTEKPAVPRGTMNAEMPLCLRPRSVVARTTAASASCAFVIQAWRWTRQSCPDHSLESFPAGQQTTGYAILHPPLPPPPSASSPIHPSSPPRTHPSSPPCPLHTRGQPFGRIHAQRRALLYAAPTHHSLYPGLRSHVSGPSLQAPASRPQPPGLMPRPQALDRPWSRL